MSVWCSACDKAGATSRWNEQTNTALSDTMWRQTLKRCHWHENIKWTRWLGEITEFSRMADAIWGGRAVSEGSLSIKKPYFGCSPSLSSRSHTADTVKTLTFKPLDSSCLFHILHRLPCSIFLHSSLKVSDFLSEVHRHGSICLNFSFPVWGVYPIPCSRAQHTSNTHATHYEKKRQKWGNT